MARFSRLAVYNTILAEGMVPLFYHADIEVSQKVAAALAAGESHVVEFTNRGDFALEVFSALVKHAAAASPDQIIGVGSVEDAPTAALYIANGANFVVGPNFNEEIARLCNRHKIAYMPGCATVTEIARAEEWGAEIVKLFPGEVVGPGFVRAIRGPRPWTSIMPTGGVTPDEKNLRAWFDAGVVCVGMGSAIVRADLINSGDYDAMRDGVTAALDLIRRIRVK